MAAAAAAAQEVHEAVSSILQNQNRSSDGQILLEPLETLKDYLEHYNNNNSNNNISSDTTKDDEGDGGFLQQRSQHQSENNNDISVRDALNFLPSSELSELTRVLSGLMEDRKEAVMPMTQDVDANEEAMNDTNALTLTATGFTAATVYAQLIAMPGAVGVGLIEMEALSSLANVLQRWRTECCGRESEMITTTKSRSNKKRSNGPKSSAPTKRSKKTNKSSAADAYNEESSYDDNGEEEEDDDFMDQSDDGLLSPRQLLTLGLTVAEKVAEVPVCREFMSWKIEAADLVVESVAGVLATTQALISGRASSGGYDGAQELGVAIVERATKALRRCSLLDPLEEHPDDEDNDVGDDDASPSDKLQKRHEMAVAILRGLYPAITMKNTLPKGESGKFAAASAASKCLESFIQELTDDLTANTSRWPKSMSHVERRSSVALTVPSTVAPSTVAPTTPGSIASSELMTPKTTHKKERKLRTSLGRSTGKSRRMSMTPKLKTTTPGSTSTVPLTTNDKPRPVFCAILGMLQKLAVTKDLEKASIRTPIVETLHRCIRHLPVTERTHFLKFLIQLCHSKVSVHRLVASELVGLVLSEDWLWAEHIHTDDTFSPAPKTPASARSKSLSPLVMESSTNMPLALFGALQGRLVDRAPTIRATSAASLANLCSRLHKAQSELGSLSAMGIVATLAVEADALVGCLRRRAVSDEKATVRKAACSALVELLVVCEYTEDVYCSISEQDISILSEVCQDNSLLTRKASAEGLTRLLECVIQSNDRSGVLPLLEKAWSSSTLTMVLDSETSCVTKATELVERLILFPILSEEEDETAERAKKAAWRILASLGDGALQGASRSEAEALRVTLEKSISAANSNTYLSSIFQSIHRVAVDTLNESECDLFAPDIENQRTGVWCLFDAAMGYTKNHKEIARVIKRSKIDLDFLGMSWDKLLQLFMAFDTPPKTKPSLQRSMRNCLQVLSQLASSVDVSLAEKTSCDLQKLISEFSLPPEIIGPAITALTATTIASCRDISEEAQNQACAVWIRSLFKCCEDKISFFVGHKVPDYEVASLARAFFMVGELSMVGFSASEDSGAGAGPSTQRSNTLSGLAIGLHERPSKQLIEFVQAFMTDSLPGLDGTPTPSAVRAHAFIALGKLCLRDSRLARQSLNILARELQTNIGEGKWIVQSNALLVLGDLCVKYTNLVDKFLPVMAACLQAGVTDITVDALGQAHRGSALVRKHAVLLLSSLLLQDYIKWRGLLFHRFLVASVDEEDDVASLAAMVLYGPLILKQPKLFSSQFVESIFVLNRCTAHEIYQAAAAMGDAGSGISVGFEGINLTGEAGRVRRMKMYQMMLSKMTDEEKIGVTFRIGKEILGGALKTGSELHQICTIAPGAADDEDDTMMYESALNVLSDAFAILSSPWIRVGKDSRDDDDIEDPNVSTSNAKRVLLAKGQLLSNISRKHLIEILLPILCNLKGILQKSRSPLLKDLMNCLLDVYQRYKSEAKECLANDPTTLQEIEYDAQQRKKAQRRGTPSQKSFLIPNAQEIPA